MTLELAKLLPLCDHSGDEGVDSHNSQKAQSSIHVLRLSENPLPKSRYIVSLHQAILGQLSGVESPGFGVSPKHWTKQHFAISGFYLYEIQCNDAATPAGFETQVVKRHL